LVGGGDGGGVGGVVVWVGVWWGGLGGWGWVDGVCFAGRCVSIVVVAVIAVLAEVQPYREPWYFSLAKRWWFHGGRRLSRSYRRPQFMQSDFHNVSLLLRVDGDED